MGARPTAKTTTMRKNFLLLMLALAMLSAGAQKTKVRAKLSETSVVKDPTGNVLPTSVWVPLYQTGKMKVDPVDPSKYDSEFTIRRYTEEEWTQKMEAMPRPLGSRAFKKNSQFTAFDETDLQGNHYKLKELKGKVVVINFWFINCPPCRMEIPDLNELVAQYKNNPDVVFLAIAMDDKHSLQEFLKRMPFKYNIIENGEYIASKNNVGAFPTHVVLDRNGKILFHTDGLAENTVYWVKKSIEQALAQKGDVAQGN
jgi:thiol-disulfide isomerase/thioredoxin